MILNSTELKLEALPHLSVKEILIAMVDKATPTEIVGITTELVVIATETVDTATELVVIATEIVDTATGTIMVIATDLVDILIEELSLD